MKLSDREKFDKYLIYLLETNAPKDVLDYFSEIGHQWFLAKKSNDIVQGKILSIADDLDLKNQAFNEQIKTGYKIRFDVLNDNVRFRKDELSLLTGINGHGKSMFLSHLGLELVDDGAIILIASLEMRRIYLYQRMMRQITAVDHPTVDYMRAVENYYKEKIFFVDHLGSINAQLLIRYMNQAYEAFGCDVFFVDSLMKCGLLEDDYNNQKKFVDMLCDFKSKNNVHIILVAHPRKGLNEKDAPGKLDIKGTGTISDMADNCFSIYKNKNKQDEIYKLVSNNLPIPEDVITKYDFLLSCDKQRNGDWEGKKAFWFDKQSLQFLSRYRGHPHRYVNYSNKLDEKECQSTSDMDFLKEKLEEVF